MSGPAVRLAAPASNLEGQQAPHHLLRPALDTLNALGLAKDTLSMGASADPEPIRPAPTYIDQSNRLETPMFKPALRSPALAELLLLLLVLLAMAHLAAPLADPSLAAGRGGRYLGDAGAQNSLPGLLHLAPQALPAGLAPLLAVLALTGWAVLRVGRLALPAGAIAVMGLALWAVPMSMLRALAAVPGWWQTPWQGWPALAQAASPLWLLPSALLLLALPVAARFTRRAWQPTQAPHRAWLYPLWVLLTGLGLLWLTDYSARAALQHRHLASQQFQALVGAYALLTVLAGLQPSLLPWLARWLARIDGHAPLASQAQPAQPAPPTKAARAMALCRRAWPRAGIFAVLMAWMLLMFLLLGRHAAQSAARAEALRAVFYLLGGWLAYRWIDTPHGARWSIWRGAAASAALFALAVLPMLGSGDKGQVLLLLLAACALGGGVVGGVLGAWAGRPRQAAVLALTLSAGAVGVVMWALYAFGAAASRTVAWRLEALSLLWDSHYEYLSELRWFMANAPPSGYGLGQVPWCGTLGSLGAGACHAIPAQTQSDYVFAALAGVWGSGVAALLVLATAAWLIGLIRVPAGPAAGLAGLAPQPQRLGAWIVVFFVGVNLVQLFVTTFGSLGLMPLTGVEFPLLGFGKSALLVAAACASLGINRPVGG